MKRAFYLVLGALAFQASAWAGQLAVGDGFACHSHDERLECWPTRPFRFERPNPISVIPPTLGRIEKLFSSPTEAYLCAQGARATDCWGYGKSSFTVALPAWWQTPQGLGVVDQLEISEGFACTLKHGSVQCWGPNYERRDLGQYKVPALAGVTQIAAGYSFACALTPTGIPCWGGAPYELQHLPAELNATNIQGMFAVDESLCIWERSGRLSCYGRYAPGEMGIYSDIIPGESMICGRNEKGMTCRAFSAWGGVMEQNDMPKRVEAFFSAAPPGALLAMGGLDACMVTRAGAKCLNSTVPESFSLAPFDQATELTEEIPSWFEERTYGPRKQWFSGIRQAMKATPVAESSHQERWFLFRLIEDFVSELDANLIVKTALPGLIQIRQIKQSELGDLVWAPRYARVGIHALVMTLQAAREELDAKGRYDTDITAQRCGALLAASSLTPEKSSQLAHFVRSRISLWAQLNSPRLKPFRRVVNTLLSFLERGGNQ